MGKQANLKLIGGFVLAGLALVVAGLLALGGREFFVQKDHAVVFFEGSIAGLRVGAPVTFRGVPVGRVANIRVRYLPKENQTVIPVILDLDPDRVVDLPGTAGSRSELIEQLIQKGFRAQLNLESFVTNQQNIQLDFFPGSPVHLFPTDLPYTPIPSVPSGLEQLQATLGGAAQNLPELIAAATATFKNVATLLGPDAQVHGARILDNLDQLTTLLVSGDTNIRQTLINLRQTTADVDNLVVDADHATKIVADNHALIVDTLQSIHVAGEQIGALVAEERPALKELGDSTLYDLPPLLADARTMVQRATTVLNSMQNDPARFFFGNAQRGVEINAGSSRK